MGEPAAHACKLGHTRSSGPGGGQVGGALLPLDAGPVDAVPEVVAAPGNVHREAVCGPEEASGCCLGMCHARERVAEAGSCPDGSWEGSPCGGSWNVSQRRAHPGVADIDPQGLCCQEHHLSR